MNETYVTLRGWLGADVRHRLAATAPVAGVCGSVWHAPLGSTASARSGSTPHPVVHREGLAPPGRQLSRLAAARRPGGRARPAEPEHLVKDGVERTSLEVTAVSVGHDLSLGTSQFRRALPRREERVEARDEVA